MNIQYNNFKKLEEIKKQPTTKKIYLRPCDINRVKIVESFLSMLDIQFKDLTIDTTYKTENVEVFTRYTPKHSNNETISKTSYISYLADTFDIYVNFKIDNYIYYLVINDNPFFEYSSYLVASRIMIDQYTQKRFIYDVCSDRFNINLLFNDDIWSIDCNIEENTINLYNHFINKVLSKQSQLHIPHPRKNPGVGVKQYLEE